MPKTWTKNQIKTLREEYPNGNLEDLMKKFDKSLGALQSAARYHGIKRTMRWTPENIKIFKHHYPNGDLNELCKLLNASKSILINSAKRYGVKRETKTKPKWTPENVELLKKEYPLGDKVKLAKFFNVTLECLHATAVRFKVKSLQDKNLYKLKFLYQNCLFAYYWMGFCMADAYIPKTSGTFQMTLSIKDVKHLQKLADILNLEVKTFMQQAGYSKIPREFCEIACRDSFYMPKIREKFNLHPDLPKTYNPPSHLDFPSDKHFLAFLIGYIDGDGYINLCPRGKGRAIMIKIHESWENILNSFKVRLEKMNIRTVVKKEKNRNQVRLIIGRKACLRFLRHFIIAHKLPVLDRKWNRVDIEEKLAKRCWNEQMPMDLLIPELEESPAIQ